MRVVSIIQGGTSGPVSTMAFATTNDDAQK